MDVMSHSWMIVRVQSFTTMLKIMMSKWRIKMLMLIIRPIMMGIIVLMTVLNIILVPCLVTPIYLKWMLFLMRLLICRHWHWHLSAILLLLLSSSFHLFFLHLESLLLKLRLWLPLVLTLLLEVCHSLLLNIDWFIEGLFLFLILLLSHLLIVFLLINSIFLWVILSL